ncbi:hypothetical protein Misp01_81960 [Microtetraspora sp. NBRC 13810]|uniref:hypothetical protein n=1 Tax=Microtetraspora sp. NBRC 13810 TaxID=3030990 RepID=UPI0024A0B39A|nr:hypothetical protein [Microtetraspora sp. NBRC 13810]GLW13068.1 hypothetical protein Misp01_81960 [Microtetraspora sp. NBRC 13810]
MIHAIRRLEIVTAKADIAVSAVSGTATATFDRNGLCEDGEFCLCQDENPTARTSVIEWTGPDTDYQDNMWFGTTDGIDNEAGEVWNLAVTG